MSAERAHAIRFDPSLLGIELEVPSWWPAPLHPRALHWVDQETPYLVCDLDTVKDRYRAFVAALPGFECFYALKCNSLPDVLSTLHGAGSRFEVASRGELELLGAHGVDPADVLYSNPVKPPSHIAAMHAEGVWRFAFDSDAELYKLARHAPGCAVYLRVRVDDSTSVFPLSHKFGVEPEQARSLMSLARRLGLRPYGVTFHVGSQCTEPAAWRRAIATIGRMLEDLRTDMVHLDFLNISGGFPAHYAEPVPAIEEIGSVIMSALDTHLPYVPAHLAAEPGRFVVAESSVMVASVLGREVRVGESWVYLDVGAYNGLIETKQTSNAWRYPLWSSRADHSSAPHDLFTVTGPTCDSSDTLFIGIPLPSTIDVGDHIYIGSTGAYTLSYASSFNGFPPPSVLYVGEP